MMRLGRLATIGLLIVALGGCAAINAARETITTAQSVAGSAVRALVGKDAVVITVSAFNSTKALATVYLEQKRCPRGVEQPTCRSPAVTKKIAKAMAQGTKARDALLDFAERHQGDGDFDLFSDLQTITGTLRSILAAYNIGG